MTAEPDSPERTTIASTKADLRELKSNSNATVRELQEFLSQLRGKSPQEMLGIVTSSQLARATIFSLIIVTGTILLFTAIPYFFGDQPATPESVAKQPTVTLPAAPAQPAPPATDPKTSDPKKPVELAPLGVNEELPAPPNTNPLEDKKDDFLKDLE